ncbi:MAG: tRNA (adenosine(37)-N6)-dimethylallyltransferase MiaA [Saprospiraceae bacterium]|nr:tRNA (adenosine(37)-N6)-dimethylallyltransferase MiaA [Saprospiraceae bacterium]
MKRLIVIGGPTASGKTNLAINLAKHFNTQIVSADSRQVFREMPIGTAQPTAAQLSEVKHHLIANISVEEPFTANLFALTASDILENEIFTSNDVAIVVGGTGLYIKSLLLGLDDLPDIDTHIRNQVQLLYQQNGITWLQEEIKKIDPVYFQSCDIYNVRRLTRALEVYFSTGNPISVYFNKPKKNLLPKDCKISAYWIDTERNTLYHQINERVEQMLSDGLLDEVRGLLQFRTLNALNTVGYSELFDYFDGKCSLTEASNLIKQHTRNYAKRQITWFRHQPDFAPISLTTAFQTILQHNELQ